MINCFSIIYVFAVPLKTKTSGEIVEAITTVLKKYKMKHFQTIQGGEWFNKSVSKLFNDYKINNYST